MKGKRSITVGVPGTGQKTPPGLFWVSGSVCFVWIICHVAHICWKSLFFCHRCVVPLKELSPWILTWCTDVTTFWFEGKRQMENWGHSKSSSDVLSQVGPHSPLITSAPNWIINCQVGGAYFLPYSLEERVQGPLRETDWHKTTQAEAVSALELKPTEALQ